MKNKFIIVLMSLIIVTGCTNNETTVEMEPMETMEAREMTSYKEVEEKTNFVKIELNTDEEIIIELYPQFAPITVENFQKLVSEKFYDGIIFHRVIEDFMIQGGDPEGTGQGGSADTIKGEFQNNGVNNTLSHTRGVISMARLGGTPDTEETMNSASSQFFIVHEDSVFLDKNYAGFGQVISGMDVVDKIATVETDSYDKPLEDITIKTITFVEVE